VAISNDLFLAILAMDAYNRGYDPGMDLPGNHIGNATLNDNVVLPNGYQSASFFAQAYTLGGKTIISYRGTDSPTADRSGFGIGVGAPVGVLLQTGLSNNSLQGKLALEFYNEVRKLSSNIELTELR
jgi:hypothetical protein